MRTCRLSRLWRLRVAGLCVLAYGVWRRGVGVLRLPTAVSDAYSGNSLKDKVNKFNDRTDLNILQTDGLRSSAPSQTQPSPKRLHCRPVFDPSEAPLNLTKVALPPEVMIAADFEAKHEPLSLGDF